MILQNDVFTGFNDLLNLIIESLPNIASGLLLAIAGIILIHFLSVFLTRFVDYLKISLGLKEMIMIIVKTAMWVLLIIGILQIIGLSNIALALSGFVAALSIGISQGFTQTVSDLVSGIQLGTDKDFQLGDVVTTGAVGEKVTGHIVEMDTKKTRIIDAKKQIHVLPNSLVDKNTWILVEKSKLRLEHLHRDDIIKVANHRNNAKGTKK